MIHEAQVHLAGYVATEPKFKKVAGDTSSARLRVAYTARRRDKETGEWSDGPTSFVTVQCWRTLADNVSMSVHKGEPVLIMGRLQIRRFEDAEGDAQDGRGGRGVVGRPRPDSWRGSVLAHPVARGQHGGRGGRPAGRCAWDRGRRGAGGRRGTRRRTGARRAPERGHERCRAAGDGVIDEHAVAEFARELSESLGAAAAADPAADGAEDAGAAAETGVPA